MHPHQRGTAQGPDVYMQCVEAASQFYDATPNHVLEAMAEVSAITGRKYSLFDYVGHPQAERVVVMMGSGSQIVEEAVNHLAAQGQKVGVLKVRGITGKIEGTCVSSLVRLMSVVKSYCGHMTPNPLCSRSACSALGRRST